RQRKFREKRGGTEGESNALLTHDKRVSNTLITSPEYREQRTEYRDKEDLKCVYETEALVGSAVSEDTHTHLNGKTQKPSEAEITEFSDWAHSVYRRHPKQTYLNPSLDALRRKFALDSDSRAIFEKNHPLWIAYW